MNARGLAGAELLAAVPLCPNPVPGALLGAALNEKGDDVVVGVTFGVLNENGAVEGFVGSAAFCCCPNAKGLEVAEPKPAKVVEADFSEALACCCCAEFPNGLFVGGVLKLNGDDDDVENQEDIGNGREGECGRGTEPKMAQEVWVG